MHTPRVPDDLPGRDEATQQLILGDAEALVDDIAHSVVLASADARTEAARDEAIAAAILTDQVRASLAALHGSRAKLRAPVLHDEF